MAKKQITNYKFVPGGVTPNTNLYLNVVALIDLNKKFIQEESVAFIAYNVTNSVAPFANYAYNVEKCRRDVAYVLEGYISDVRHGSNRMTVTNAAKYFENGVAQVRQYAETATHTFIKNLIVNYILTNTTYPSRQAIAAQSINQTYVAENAGITAISTLNDVIINVITSGLTSLPSVTSNRGYIKFPGLYKQKDILLITNTTRNQIMYNFADPTNRIDLTYSENYDSDFSGALYGQDKITTITLDYDTSSHMVTDQIQIFVESKSLEVRLNPIATDAMERMKVGIPQSMLDADFEYGLQPTKWQAIALMRNYPSVYEIPGSDTAIVNVTTDASTGTSGTGSSLITVNTLASHGFTAGSPFTIKALANSVLGFSRAEGTFLINSVPTSTSFTYYAKSKVGSNSGDVLSTAYTQVRKALFYTGAAIGSPTFSVYSNGSSGTITTSLITPSGSKIIGFASGTTPIVGAPITGTGVNAGVQITAVTGPGGTAASTTLTTLANSGNTSVTVDSTTGIGPGLVFDRGDGTAIAVTDVTGNVVSFSGTLTSSIVGTTQNYTGVTGTTGGSGTGAVFTVARNGTSYTATATTAGNNYSVSDTITILGTSLGGAASGNNATLTVTAASNKKAVDSFDITSLLGGAGYTTSTGVATTVSPSGGSGLTVNITAVAGVVTAVTVASEGAGYSVGDTITIVHPDGAVLTTSALLTLGTGYASANSVATTVSPSGGTGLTVDILDDGNGGIASFTIVTPGTGYNPGDTITITGGGGNATFTVSTVSTQATIQILTTLVGGEIQSLSASGNPITASAKNFISAFTINDITQSQIASGNTGLSFTGISVIEVNFATNHGFVPGSSITVAISSAGTNAQLAAGAYYIEQVPTATSLRYTARAAGVISNSLVGTIYARPDSYFVHRPFDGGVQLGTGGPAHGATAIRMSKKYIRYQSGKGVMYNTGALFAPSYDLRNLTANGTAVGSIITITTDDTDHGCQVGAQITISGVTTSGYNGVYSVIGIIDERNLQVLAATTLGSTTAVLGDPVSMAVRTWHGSTVRSGIFDDQNGMFWQYDGIQMSVVKRSSTFQVAGNIAINKDSNQVTGTNTRFTTQLNAGDRVVIRGMSHVVSAIQDDTTMFVTPDFRGVNNVINVKIVKTIDLIVPQGQWNQDPCNGTGPSGYSLDVTKMQMIGIQHTWYGAGFIDFMLRGPEGNYIFVHRFRNSNVNSEAYMRSGNQPVRYEVINEGAKSRLTATIDSAQTTIPVADTTYFPSAGTVLIDNELIRYTANNGVNALTGCVRGTSLTQFVGGSQRSFSAGPSATHASTSGVVLVSNTITPIISHWGSAFMIDGQFDSDRGYIFNYAATSVPVNLDKNTAFLIRLAPSVSNAQTGDLGEKELLNRAQFLLSQISVTSDTVSGGGAIVVEGVLNPINYPTDPTLITWTGLSTQAAGGQPSFSQVASGGSVTWGGGSNQTNATVQGAFSTTMTAKSFSAVTTTVTATSFNAVTQTASAASFLNTQVLTALGFATTQPFTLATVSMTALSFSAGQPFGNNSYVSATSTARNDIIITTAQFDALSPQPQTGDTLSGTGISAGARITAIVRNVASTSYTQITMSAFGTSTSAAGSGNNVTVNSSPANRYISATDTYRNDFIITNTQYDALTAPLAVGDTITGTGIPVGATIASVTRAYLSSSYTQVVLSAKFTVTSTAGSGNNVALSSTSQTLTTYANAISTARNDFLIPQSTYAGILASTPIVLATDPVSATTFVTGGQTVSSITPNYITLGGVAYARIVMSSSGNVTSTAATANGNQNVTVTFTSVLAARYNTALSASRTDFLIPQTQFATTSALVTDVLSVSTYLTASQTISSFTANYVTIGGTAYARVVMAALASAASVAGTGNNVTVTVTSAATATYGTAISSARSDFLITQAQYATISGIAVGDVLSVATYITGGQTISSITPNYITISGTLYARIVMSAAANSTSTTGSSNDITVVNTASGSGASYAKTNYLFFTQSTFEASGATIGTKVATSYTSFPAGTSIAGLATRQFSTAVSVITGAVSSGGATTVTYTLTGTNIYSVGSSVTITGITGGTGMNGTFVVTSSTAGTLIVTSTGSGTPSSYTGASLVGALTYRATFTQSGTGTINSGQTPTFQFGAAYALPGETVFSFVSNPGNTDTLALSDLKELTSTAIGGRGAFPNGPDTLAINVYKVSGTTTNANIVIRWSEAQA